LVWQWFFHF